MAWPLHAITFLHGTQADGAITRSRPCHVPPYGRHPCPVQPVFEVGAWVCLSVLCWEVVKGLPIEASRKPPGPQRAPLCLSTQM